MELYGHMNYWYVELWDVWFNPERQMIHVDRDYRWPWRTEWNLPEPTWLIPLEATSCE